MKLKFAMAHMKAAEVYSELSTADRLKVGCVIVQNDTIIGIGYNGMPHGKSNVCEYLDDRGEKKTKPEVLHAETNALAKVARSTNTTEDAYMFVTHAPCLDCAKLIYQAGISKVFYRNSYRSSEGVDFLKDSGVDVLNI